MILHEENIIASRNTHIFVKYMYSISVEFTPTDF